MRLIAIPALLPALAFPAAATDVGENRMNNFGVLTFKFKLGQ